MLLERLLLQVPCPLFPSSSSSSSMTATARWRQQQQQLLADDEATQREEDVEEDSDFDLKRGLLFASSLSSSSSSSSYHHSYAAGGDYDGSGSQQASRCSSFADEDHEGGRSNFGSEFSWDMRSALNGVGAGGSGSHSSRRSSMMAPAMSLPLSSSSDCMLLTEQCSQLLSSTDDDECTLTSSQLEAIVGDHATDFRANDDLAAQVGMADGSSMTMMMWMPAGGSGEASSL
jgi:hypothetical protein